MVAGLKFLPTLQGQPVKIVRALYGLKSLEAQFKYNLAVLLWHRLQKLQSGSTCLDEGRNDG